jgi:hypothetical protein
MGNDQLQRRKILEHARAQELHGAREILADVVGAGRMHGRVAGCAGVDGAGDAELHHFLPQRIPPFITERGREGLTASSYIRVDIAGHKPLLCDTALQLFYPGLGADARRLRQLTDRRELVRPQPGDTCDEVVAGLGPVTADQLRAKVMPHGGGLGRKHQAVDPSVLHALELVAHGPLQLLIADLQPRPWGIGQVHDLTAAIGL